MSQGGVLKTTLQLFPELFPKNEPESMEIIVPVDGGFEIKTISCDCGFRGHCDKCGTRIHCVSKKHHNRRCRDDDETPIECSGSEKCRMSLRCEKHKDSSAEERKACEKCQPSIRCPLHENCKISIFNAIQLKE